MSELGEFAMYGAIGLTMVGIFFGPIARAVGRWIESKAGGAPRRMVDLENRVAELEALLQRTPAEGVPAARLAELEERLDFTERMLAQREPEQLR